MNILFVCTGNTCRSPMAAALMKEKYGEADVLSAGIFAYNGSGAAPQAIAALEEVGIAAPHQSQNVTPELLEWADLVLTMTTGHKQSLIMQYPGYQNKYFTLKEYTAETDKEVWTHLKKLQTELETEQATLSAERKAELLAEIGKLESKLINYDISDPFGGPIELYRETLKELDRHLGLLSDKLKRQ
ncbi:low molecular weight protein arginine phosphatase [Aciduricibacillus chroicocephali]|uniref:Low molecular weight protein arginine phosphatase n=1 Tax=Aciduricibacillus chroicocephali TaxID=3054939 RepID=A0ABY9KTQ9_9BACI|nr:low molecular weight protein arginine phosphatase [Bacillaceae bacterium 44XB]